MPANENTVYQFNIKVGNDLHNIYAENGPEAIELLDYFSEELLPKLTSLNSVTTAAVHAAPLAAPAHQQPPASPFAGQPSAAPAAPAQHLCACGTPMAFRPPGVSKNTGKPYPGFYSCANGKPPQGCGQTLNA